MPSREHFIQEQEQPWEEVINLNSDGNFTSRAGIVPTKFKRNIKPKTKSTI